MKRKHASGHLAALLLFSASAHAVDYPGTGVGLIPDDDPNGLVINFDTTGAPLPVGNVRVTLFMAHDAVGDLEATLISPGGFARAMLFGRPGQKRTPSGQDANLDGTYTFDDAATGDLWATIAGQPSTYIVPTGSYRTSTKGFGTLAVTDAGGCATYLGGAFYGLSPARLDGTWTLVIADRAMTNIGIVLSATLSIDGIDLPIFSTGFEDDAPAVPTFPTGSAVRGSCTPAPLDFTGSGLTSYTVVRNTGGGPSGDVTWFVKDNDGTSTGAVTSFVHGKATDFFLDGDYDGDGIADATIWRPGSAARFQIRRSSRPTDELLTLDFGRSGDEPTHGGDYDGDGIDDPTLYRPGAFSGELSHTLIYLSSTGTIRDLLTGQNGDFANGGVDYDGDGAADMTMRSNAGGGVGRYTLYSGVTGDVVTTFDFGTPTDVMVTGSHAGTPRGDITAVRGVGGVIQWTTRDSETGAITGPIDHGMSATDFLLPGDYDGDGVEDYAVWRPNADPAMTKFIIRPSTNPMAPFEVFHGRNGDYSMANNRAH